MTSIGYPDLLRFATLNRPTLELRQQLTDVSKELVTGRKSDLARDLGRNVGDYNLVSKALADIEASQNRLALAGNRLDATELPIKALRENLTGYAAETQSILLTSGKADEVTRNAAESRINSVFSALNSSFGGRFLFSGDAVDRPPLAGADEFFTALEAAIGGATDEVSIDTAITAFFADGGDFDTLIYQGGTGDAASVQLSSGDSLSYNTRANDPAFKSLLEGYTRIAYAAEEISPDYLNGAVDQLFSAETLLLDQESFIGEQQSKLATALELSNEEKVILGESENDYAGVDPFDAATRLQNLEIQLQAAFTVTARLSQLSLTNFIR